MGYCTQGSSIKKVAKYSPSIVSPQNRNIRKISFNAYICQISNTPAKGYLAPVLFTVGNGLMWPSVISILTKCAGTLYQGAVQGVASSFASLANIIGLTTGGILYILIGATPFLIN